MLMSIYLKTSIAALDAVGKGRGRNSTGSACLQLVASSRAFIVTHDTCPASIPDWLQTRSCRRPSLSHKTGRNALLLADAGMDPISVQGAPLKQRRMPSCWVKEMLEDRRCCQTHLRMTCPPMLNLESLLETSAWKLMKILHHKKNFGGKCHYAAGQAQIR
jgi:hypothetical protein